MGPISRLEHSAGTHEPRFEDAAVRGWKTDEPSATTSWSPAVDIYETDSEIMVQAELPGVDRKDIALQLENNVLTLKGDRRFEKETNQETIID